MADPAPTRKLLAKKEADLERLRDARAAHDPAALAETVKAAEARVRDASVQEVTDPGPETKAEAIAARKALEAAEAEETSGADHAEVLDQAIRKLSLEVKEVGAALLQGQIRAAREALEARLQTKSKTLEAIVLESLVLHMVRGGHPFMRERASEMVLEVVGLSEDALLDRARRLHQRILGGELLDQVLP